MSARLAVACLLPLALVAGCGGTKNKDPRDGRVIIEETNCLWSTCIYDYKVCVGPDMFYNVAGEHRWVKNAPECKP